MESRCYPAIPPAARSITSVGRCRSSNGVPVRSLQTLRHARHANVRNPSEVRRRRLLVWREPQARTRHELFSPAPLTSTTLAEHSWSRIWRSRRELLHRCADLVKPRVTFRQETISVIDPVARGSRASGLTAPSPQPACTDEQCRSRQRCRRSRRRANRTRRRRGAVTSSSRLHRRRRARPRRDSST